MNSQSENATSVKSVHVKLSFKNQILNESKNFHVVMPYFPATRQFRINEALDGTCQRGLNLIGSQIFLADFSNRVNLFLGVYPFKMEVMIGLESVYNDSIELNYRPPSNGSSIHAEKEGSERATKVKKVKQRTIEAAVEAVKLWRSLYENALVENNGKRVFNLADAADEVGIAKKTLDDYYVHIKLASELNFNFELHWKDKMGTLRKYVKAEQFKRRDQMSETSSVAPSVKFGSPGTEGCDAQQEVSEISDNLSLGSLRIGHNLNDLENFFIDLE